MGPRYGGASSFKELDEGLAAHGFAERALVAPRAVGHCRRRWEPEQRDPATRSGLVAAAQRATPGGHS